MEKAIRIGMAFNSGVQESGPSSLPIQSHRRQAEESHLCYMFMIQYSRAVPDNKIGGSSALTASLFQPISPQSSPHRSSLSPISLTEKTARIRAMTNTERNVPS